MEVVGNGTYGQVYKVCVRISSPFIVADFPEGTRCLRRAEHTAEGEPPALAAGTVRGGRSVALVIVTGLVKFVSLLASAFSDGYKLLSQVPILK